MKNILYTLFIAVFVLCSCQKQSNKNIDADIIIFTQQGCSHCEKAIDFLNNKLLVNNPAVRSSTTNSLWAGVLRTRSNYNGPLSQNKNRLNKKLISCQIL